MSNITICFLPVQINDTHLKTCMVTTLHKIFSGQQRCSVVHIHKYTPCLRENISCTHWPPALCDS